MSQSKCPDAVPRFVSDCGYGLDDKYCHHCGAELTTIFGGVFFDEQTGQKKQYTHKRCAKTKKFLWWEVYACPTNICEM